MAQLINSDTGILVEEGKTEAEFLAWEGYDPTHNEVVDTGQTFELNRVPKRQIWFYFPSLNIFVQSTRHQHAILTAAKSLFTETRWDEIEDILEEHGAINEILNRLDLRKMRRKIQRARQKGLITAAEVSALSDLVAHL